MLSTVKMRRELVFTETADQQYEKLLSNRARKGVLKQVQKTLASLETLEPGERRPSLHTHEYHSIRGLNGEKVLEAYVQHRTPAAYRVFFHYGPDRIDKGRRIPVITIVAITSHP